MATNSKSPFRFLDDIMDDTIINGVHGVIGMDDKIGEERDTAVLYFLPNSSMRQAYDLWKKEMSIEMLDWMNTLPIQQFHELVELRFQKEKKTFDLDEIFRKAHEDLKKFEDGTYRRCYNEQQENVKEYLQQTNEPFESQVSLCFNAVVEKYNENLKILVGEMKQMHINQKESTENINKLIESLNNQFERRITLVEERVAGMEKQAETISELKIQLEESQQKANNTEADDEEKFVSACPDIKEAYNIVLLGDSGVGKTTFINSFANYIKFKTWDDALDGDVEILTPVKFYLYVDKDTNGVQEIQLNPKNASKEQKDNENLRDHNTGESVTRECQIYEFPIRINNKDIVIRLIDTPGINDTRSNGQDEKNFQMALNKMEEFEKLTAIFILLKPNEDKITPEFKHRFNLLLGQLSPSAKKNIVFCFTKTETTDYGPGNTIDVLRDYFQRNHYDIKLEDNYVCFANDCFRSLCIKTKFPQSFDERFDGEQSWNHNKNELIRLFTLLEMRVPHVTDETYKIAKFKHQYERICPAFIDLLIRITEHIIHFQNTTAKDKVSSCWTVTDEISYYCALFIEFLNANSIGKVTDSFRLQLSQTIDKELTQDKKVIFTEILNYYNRIRTTCKSKEQIILQHVVQQQNKISNNIYFGKEIRQIFDQYQKR